MTYNTSEDLAVPVVPADVVATKTREASAFLRACRPLDVLQSGTALMSYRAPALGLVAEGASKPLSQGTVTKTEVYAQKIANIETITMEAAAEVPTLTRALLEEPALTVGRDIDNIILNGGSNLISGFSKTEGPEQFRTVTTAAELTAAYAYVSASGEMPSAYVLSTAALVNLYNIGQEGIRSPLSNLTLDKNNPGTIHGLPVYVFASADPNDAFLGAFDSAAFGGIRRGYPEVKVSTEATLVDPNSFQVHPLWQNNEIGILTECFFAFKIANYAAFVRLVTDEVAWNAPPEGGIPGEGE